jgi:hypothetical protein
VCVREWNKLLSKEKNRGGEGVGGVGQGGEMNQALYAHMNNKRKMKKKKKEGKIMTQK